MKNLLNRIDIPRETHNQVNSVLIKDKFIPDATSNSYNKK